MTNKYPVVIPYIHTKDCGMELKYSLRSLKNITNWDGEVYIVGDREIWFSGKIKYIPHTRIKQQYYYDQIDKIITIIDELPEQFIVSMDDVYVTKPMKITAYNQGKLTGEGNSYHARTKKYTLEAIKSGYPEALDFECHAPMLVDKGKLRDVLEFYSRNKNKGMLQWRSLYGNIQGIKSMRIEDAKTKTHQLKEGAIISTNTYTDELDKLFPEPSQFELTPHSSEFELA